MVHKQEWVEFKCGQPSSIPNFTPPDRRPLNNVRHIVHIPHALQILENSFIPARLVNDISKLNTHRVNVVWFSANSWPTYGSIYGTVEFVYDWNFLVKKKYIYWVEAIRKYSPNAYRFLITRNDMSDSYLVENGILIPYDPDTDNGPLRIFNGNWYFNEIYTSEFMINEPIKISDCIELNFVKHNKKCPQFGWECPDRGKETNACVLAHILGNRIMDVNELLCDNSSEDEFLNDNSFYAIRNLNYFFKNNSNFNGPIKSSTYRQYVLRGALSLFAKGCESDSYALISTLYSEKILKKALVEIIQEHFNIEHNPLTDI